MDKANFHTLVIDAAPRKNGTHNDNTVQHLEWERTVNDVQFCKVYEGCFSLFFVSMRLLFYLILLIIFIFIYSILEDLIRHHQILEDLTRHHHLITRPS